MTGIDALEALKSGKKVRPVEWRPNAYIEKCGEFVFIRGDLECDQSVMSEIEAIFDLLLANEGWEIVE
jgi:hypothetical protein